MIKDPEMILFQLQIPSTHTFWTSKEADPLITGKQHHWRMCWEHESLCLYGTNYLQGWKIKKLNYVSVDACSEARH